jgi:hypothetical protein
LFTASEIELRGMWEERITSSVNWNVSVPSQVKCHKEQQTLIPFLMLSCSIHEKKRKEEDICVYQNSKWISICSQDVAADIKVIYKM